MVPSDKYGRHAGLVQADAPVEKFKGCDERPVTQDDMSWLKEGELLNIKSISVTEDVFQEPMSWLKSPAPRNILLIVVTEDVFQEPMSWLKTFALPNILFISVTEDVSQEPMSWLNKIANLNIWPIPVTEDVFQEPMSWLNATAPRNILLISVTQDVFHKATSGSLNVVLFWNINAKLTGPGLLRYMPSFGTNVYPGLLVRQVALVGSTAVFRSGK